MYKICKLKKLKVSDRKMYLMPAHTEDFGLFQTKDEHCETIVVISVAVAAKRCFNQRSPVIMSVMIMNCQCHISVS